MLRSDGSGLDALCNMCNHDDPRIRYMAACILMETRPFLAVRTLRALKEESGKIAQKAEAALEVWENRPLHNPHQ
jgi:hypothetical protein